MSTLVSVNTLAQSKCPMILVAGFFFGMYFQKLVFDLLILTFVIFLNFIITVRGTAIELVLWRFFLYSQHSSPTYILSH